MKKFNWDFIEANTKQTTHIFHTYPAMLVPQIADKLLDTYGKKNALLFDPFCGTGTTLVEANLRSINAVGTDLNPLARLISKVKTTIIEQQTLDLYLKDFYDYLFTFRFDFSKKESVTVPSFPNINYWFSKSIITDLAVIKNYIDLVEEEPIKDFFKVAFSQTIRDCSWTRKNEFKLYKMEAEKTKTFKPDVFSAFEFILSRNRNGLVDYSKKKTNRSYTEIYDFNTVKEIPSNILEDEIVDLVITSPPYGDSSTTVAYGQFSRLTNQWLCYKDANKLDSELMGGKKIESIPKYSSKILNRDINKLLNIDENRCNDVASFYSDYSKSIANISRLVKKKGYACYIVSNRCVKGVILKTHKITQDFFEESGFKHIGTYERKISNKRMPRKNSPVGITGKTKTLMNKEYIVVMKKK